MKYRVYKSILSIVIILYCGIAGAITNLTFAKQEVEKYYDSGRYFKELQMVIQKAKVSLMQQVQHNSSNKKLALVLDIDDTAISNYADLKSIDFGGNYDMRYQLLLKGNEPAIDATLSLYKLAIEKGVNVFFITGRPEKARDLTVKVLQKDGYSKWTSIYFKTDEYKDTSAEHFKTAVRKKITEQGYQIVENVGDQWSDLKGGYALTTYKLPNPFYFIP